MKAKYLVGMLIILLFLATITFMTTSQVSGKSDTSDSLRQQLEKYENKLISVQGIYGENVSNFYLRSVGDDFIKLEFQVKAPATGEIIYVPIANIRFISPNNGWLRISIKPDVRTHL